MLERVQDYFAQIDARATAERVDYLLKIGADLEDYPPTARPFTDMLRIAMVAALFIWATNTPPLNIKYPNNFFREQRSLSTPTPPTIYATPQPSSLRPHN